MTDPGFFVDDFEEDVYVGATRNLDDLPRPNPAWKILWGVRRGELFIEWAHEREES